MKRKLYPYLQIMLIIVVINIASLSDITIRANGTDSLYNATIATLQGYNGGFPESSLLRGLIVLNNLPTDEAHCAWQDDGIQEQNTLTWSVSPHADALYLVLKGNIEACNRYLTKNVTVNSQEKGDILFLRALYYSYLLDFYGSTPIIGTTTLPVSSSELFNYIQNDLESALQYLPEKSNPFSGENILIPRYGTDIAGDTISSYKQQRPGKAAANALLSRLALNKGDYGKTMEYAMAVINSSEFALADNYVSLFMADNGESNASREIIFSITYDGEQYYNKNATYAGTRYLVASTHFPDMLSNGLNDSWAGTRARPELVNRFEVNDKRALFYSNGRSLEITNPTNIYDGYSITKFTNMRSDSISGFPYNTDMDFPLIRLAEVYLNYIEAAIRSGQNQQQATQFINILRQRAGLSTITPQELTLDYILDERSRELYMEGHRRTDLIRFGRFTSGNYLWSWKGGVIGGKEVAEDYNYYSLPAIEFTVEEPGTLKAVIDELYGTDNYERVDRIAVKGEINDNDFLFIKSSLTELTDLDLSKSYNNYLTHADKAKTLNDAGAESVLIISENAFEGMNSLINVTFPNNIWSIEKNAFKNCTNLRTINSTNQVLTPPDYLISIKEGAFENCTSLTIDLGLTNVTTIGINAFRNSALTSLKAPKLRNLPQNAFAECTKLISAYFGSNLMSIESGALSNCTNLTSVVLEDVVTPPDVAENAFDNSIEGLKIIVPYNSLGNYAAHSTWNTLPVFTLKYPIALVGYVNDWQTDLATLDEYKLFQNTNSSNEYRLITTGRTITQEFKLIMNSSGYTNVSGVTNGMLDWDNELIFEPSNMSGINKVDPDVWNSNLIFALNNVEDDDLILITVTAHDYYEYSIEAKPYDPSNINEVTNNVSINTGKGMISASFDTKSIVALYQLDGVAIVPKSVHYDSFYQDGLTSGVYILVIDNQAYKVVVK